MKTYTPIISLIPQGSHLDIDDVGHLFYHYIEHSTHKSPHLAAVEWLERMNDVCLEEWGTNLDLSGGKK